LNLDENMSPIINFFDKTCKMQTALHLVDEEPKLTFYDKYGKNKLEFGLKESLPCLNMNGNNDNNYVFLGVSKDVGPSLMVNHIEGEKGAFITSKDMALFEKDGKSLIWSVP